MRVRDVPAAAVIVIVIAGGVDEEGVQAAVREVTVVAIPAAVADAEDGKYTVASTRLLVTTKGRSDAALFVLSLCQNDKRLKMLSGICCTAVMM